MSNPSAPDAHILQLLRLLEESPVVIGFFDASDCLRWANRAFRTTYGLLPGEEISFANMMRRCFATHHGALIESDDIENWLTMVSTRRGKLPYRSFETDMCDGTWLWMTETLDADGCLLCVGTDISDLRTGERDLRLARDGALRAARTDVLTGISNRAHIMQQLQACLKRVQAERNPCGLVVMDLDNFKEVNDSFGHQTGDAVLKHFASTVFATLRRKDGFGRVGGEEFMLLLPDTDAMQIERIVQRILQGVRQARPLPEQPEFYYTCSAGLFLLHPDIDLDGSYQLADEALYAAKKAGRDRLMWATGAM